MKVLKLAAITVIMAFAALALTACGGTAVTVSPVEPAPPVKIINNNNVIVNPTHAQAAPKPVYHAPAAPVAEPVPPVADPFTVVTDYFAAMGGQNNLPYAWSLLSSGEQASMGSYSQWAANRSDISSEYATQISEYGDQVTVALAQNHYDGSSSSTTATFTVIDSVITAVG